MSRLELWQLPGRVGWCQDGGNKGKKSTSSCVIFVTFRQSFTRTPARPARVRVPQLSAQVHFDVFAWPWKLVAKRSLLCASA